MDLGAIQLNWQQEAIERVHNRVRISALGTRRKICWFCRKKSSRITHDGGRNSAFRYESTQCLNLAFLPSKSPWQSPAVFLVNPLFKFSVVFPATASQFTLEAVVYANFCARV